MSRSVIWHDLECGSYRADLPLWRWLASDRLGPVLEIGAGTGRVALELARDGHRVTALDRDGELLAALAARAEELAIDTVTADARAFALRRRYPLILVPMQTIQLLGGPDGRQAFLRRAAAHLTPGGVIAAAIAARLEPFAVREGAPGPLPEICERDGWVYCSQPTAVRALADGFVLERRRELVAPDGARKVERDRVQLDRLSAPALEREGALCGLAPRERLTIAPTAEHVGSEVVVLGV